jgi:hypothetical protein
MALINQGGKLLLQNGALASGAACCCGSSLCCTCGIIELTHVARYDNWGDTNIAPGLAPTEQDALDAQAAYIAATGWARGAVGGNGPGDGMSLADAAQALAGYGCDDTVTVSARPPYYYSDGFEEGWVIPLPSITVRCCGTFLPEGGPYEDPFANPPVLKAGAIDTWPWVVEGGDYREVLFPCVDDGSNMFCVPCSDSTAACQFGPCTEENLPCTKPQCCAFTHYLTGDDCPSGYVQIAQAGSRKVCGIAERFGPDCPFTNGDSPNNSWDEGLIDWAIGKAPFLADCYDPNDETTWAGYCHPETGYSAAPVAGAYEYSFVEDGTVGVTTVPCSGCWAGFSNCATGYACLGEGTTCIDGACVCVDNPFP